MKAKRQHADERVKAHEAFYRKGKAGGWREDLDAVGRYRFDMVAGDLLIELGYAKEGWWAESSLQKVGLPFVRRLWRGATLLLGPTLTRRVKQSRSVEAILGHRRLS
jgi:hypothetical protein